MKNKPKEEQSSFGNPAVDLPAEFINKYVVCYLKHCIAGTGSVGGLFVGMRKIKGEEHVCFEAEEGHDFMVPRANVAYYRLMSEEILEKQQKEQEKRTKEAEEKEEESIKSQIEEQMNKVQEQRKNASQSKSPGDPEAETEGDSDFVFKV